MSGVWAVIRREFLERVRSRWFILSTVVLPLFLVGAIVLPIVMSSSDETAARRIVVVDRTGLLYDRVSAELGEGGLEVARSGGGEGELARLELEARDGDIGGYLVLDDQTLARGAARFTAGQRPSPLRQLSIRSAVVQAALEARLGERGTDVESLLGGGELDLRVLAADTGDVSEPEYLSVFVGTFLLYMMVLAYSVAVMRSTLEEKTSRIVEVVISSMPPWHLMLGKILGVGAVGLAQVAIWALVLVVGGIMGLPALVAARPELGQLSEAGQYLPGLGYAGVFVVFFLGGYFIFSALFAAVGAAVNSEQEAAQAQFPVMLLIVGPIVILPMILQDPGSGLATGLSLVPFFSPVLMFARASLGVAAGWQVALSVVLMAATVVGVAWVAGRIYKVGILMAGKRPTLPELVRWVREA
ncbi:MAG TPA: ABC transporter permease [Longimicrobiales bacterium]|nr:ABC transporter permease [Longimicrobiales bacterium]